jgi:hypothetical protein
MVVIARASRGTIAAHKNDTDSYSSQHASVVTSGCADGRYFRGEEPQEHGLSQLFVPDSMTFPTQNNASVWPAGWSLNRDKVQG